MPIFQYEQKVNEAPQNKEGSCRINQNCTDGLPKKKIWITTEKKVQEDLNNELYNILLLYYFYFLLYL